MVLKLPKRRDSERKVMKMCLGKAKQMTKALGLGFLVVSSSACVEYTIETTLHTDGSGFREERMEVTKNDDLEMSPGTFGELMRVTAQHGWTRSLEVDSKGDTTNIFLRKTRIGDLESWSDLNGAVYIAGSAPADSNTRVGYVTLGDIRFRNQVEVEKGTVTDGSTSFTYRETFYWEEAIDVLVESSMSVFSQALSEKYPLLSGHELGEMVGIARAHLWTALDGGYFDLDGDEDRLMSRARDLTTEQAVNILKMRYPQESGFFLKDLLHKLYRGEGAAGQEWEAFLEEHLPGIDLAIYTGIQIRLNMPGRVMNSNHHQMDGSTLVWEFEHLNAVASPIEIFAESFVGG